MCSFLLLRITTHLPKYPGPSEHTDSRGDPGSGGGWWGVLVTFNRTQTSSNLIKGWINTTKTQTCAVSTRKIEMCHGVF